MYRLRGAVPGTKTAKQTLHDDDIMGLDATEMNVTEWQWRRST
jgi:hypothetical protein